MKSYVGQPSGTISRARTLRRDATEAEKILWRGLREKLPGTKWRRQVPVGYYFADFLCFAAKLIVEVDGSQHAETAHDERRTGFLNREGYRVLRFWNNDVLANIDGVLETIAHSLSHREREGAPKARKGAGDHLTSSNYPSPSPSHAAARRGPLPLPVGEGMQEFL